MRLSNLAEATAILLRYSDTWHVNVDAEIGAIFIGDSKMHAPEALSKEDRDRLEALGWRWSDTFADWQHFT